MSKRCTDTEGISWEQADVRQMDQLPSESVDIAFDKGTLDVMIHGSPWDPPYEVLVNTGRYLREVRPKQCPLYIVLLREYRLIYGVGLSCPQMGRDISICNVPATSLHKTSS